MRRRDRHIYNLLGLTFDAIGMEGTVNAILDAINGNQKLILSTPNLNFLVASLKSEAFRRSVLNSNLSIADGMPIVFMCKLLNIPITERVAGSSLIDELRNNITCRNKPIKVFFFGGQDGIAERAHKKLNQDKGGLTSVGYLNPGFGTVQDMSSTDIIEIAEAACRILAGVVTWRAADSIGSAVACHQCIGSTKGRLGRPVGCVPCVLTDGAAAV